MASVEKYLKPEVINQIAFQVIGNDLTVTIAAEAGQLQLNAMEPVIVFNILQSMRMLTRGMNVLREKCIDGIEADEERCRELLEHSLVAVTAINPYIGYDSPIWDPCFWFMGTFFPGQPP